MPRLYLKEPNCPHCGRSLTGATSVDGNTFDEPTVGCFSLCIYCGKWNVFEGDRWRRATAKEVIELFAEDDRAVLADYIWQSKIKQ